MKKYPQEREGEFRAKKEKGKKGTLPRPMGYNGEGRERQQQKREKREKPI